MDLERWQKWRSRRLSGLPALGKFPAMEQLRTLVQLQTPWVEKQTCVPLKISVCLLSGKNAGDRQLKKAAKPPRVENVRETKASSRSRQENNGDGSQGRETAPAPCLKCDHEGPSFIPTTHLEMQVWPCLLINPVLKRRKQSDPWNPLASQWVQPGLLRGSRPIRNLASKKKRTWLLWNNF